METSAVEAAAVAMNLRRETLVLMSLLLPDGTD
jgi:hypothetical protein